MGVLETKEIEQVSRTTSMWLITNFSIMQYVFWE